MRGIICKFKQTLVFGTVGVYIKLMKDASHKRHRLDPLTIIPLLSSGLMVFLFPAVALANCAQQVQLVKAGQLISADNIAELKCEIHQKAIDCLGYDTFDWGNFDEDIAKSKIIRPYQVALLQNALKYLLAEGVVVSGGSISFTRDYSTSDNEGGNITATDINEIITTIGKFQCGYTCQGIVPDNATACDNNLTLLNDITSYSLVNSCTPAAFCQATCNLGYILSGDECVTK